MATSTCALITNKPSIPFTIINPSYSSPFAINSSCSSPFSIDSSRNVAYSSSSLHPVPSSPVARSSVGSNNPSSTPPILGRGTPRVTRVPSTRASPTQEQLTTTPSNPSANGNSSPPRGDHASTQVRGSEEVRVINIREGSGTIGRVNGEGTGTGRINGEGTGVGRVNNGEGNRGLVRNQSTSRSRHGSAPLTRQQMYRSRNFLHHDLQLPDGYGKSQE